MRAVSVVLVLAAALASAGLAGCSAGSTGASTAPASLVSAVADPIPPVREPKDLAGAAPCALLNPVQLAANRIDQPGQRKDVLGAPGCQWDDRAHTREIRIYTDISNDVLHTVYTQRATFPVFELTEVAGHPAIRTKNNVDGTSCFFRVAVAPKQTVVVGFTSLRQGSEEPCGPAKELAATIIGNLPALKG